MLDSHPLLIVLSSTRNYGWITRAFLEGNLYWADYIVIVDQMSTDGTREMCAEYGDKVVLVDDQDMAYKESTRSITAFYKGRELAGNHDHIFFALDIDEVMPANWMDTKDGHKILDSKPGDEFSLHWANLNPDCKTYFEDEFINPWEVQYKIFHDDSEIEFVETGLQMHSPKLPYINYDTPPYEIKNFPLLHFGHFNLKWNNDKLMYYQILDIRQKHSKSLISLNRFYFQRNLIIKKDIPIRREWFFDKWDIFKVVDTTSSSIFVNYIKEIVENDGIDKYVKLNIWSDDICDVLGITNPHKWYHKLFYLYISKTQKYKNKFLIKGFDKILKLFV